MRLLQAAAGWSLNWVSGSRPATFAPLGKLGHLRTGYSTARPGMATREEAPGGTAAKVYNDSGSGGERMLRKLSGCAGVVFIVVLLALWVFMAGWPKIVAAAGQRAQATVRAKREFLEVRYAQWSRRYEITADFPVPGEPLQRQVFCRADEEKYDAMHLGSGVTVYYLASLFRFPLLPAAYLADCNSPAGLHLPAGELRLWGWVLASLAAILILWRVLKIKLALLLLLPWVGFVVGHYSLPHAEPAPGHPQAGTAQVAVIYKITRMFDSSEEYGTKLDKPYLIVGLRFQPPGMEQPVVAVDKVDADSVPNLAEKQTVKIAYDAGHPRIARMEGATRRFPFQAVQTVIVGYGLVVVFVALVVIWAWATRKKRRTPHAPR